MNVKILTMSRGKEKMGVDEEGRLNAFKRGATEGWWKPRELKKY